ncbi:MAG: phage holin family protein [Sphingomicrobium sp.]
MLKRTDPDPLGGDDRSIGDTIGQVLDDGRAYAQAEIDLLKVRANAEVNRYRKAAVLGGAATALAFAALVAFAMTLVIGFARLLGPFGGGAAAMLLLALGAFALFSLARGSIEDRPGADIDEDEDD